MSRTRRYAIGGGALVVALFTAGIAIGLPGDPESGQAITAPGDPEQGQAITAVRAVQGATESATSLISFVTLPGAVTSGPIILPPGASALMLVRFSAESQCDGDPGTACFVQIRLVSDEGHDLEAFPRSANAVFDQVGIGSTDDRNEAHAIDRWRVVGPFADATHWRARVRFKVGIAVGGLDDTFTLDDWSLILERSDKG
jgi:hypothetical protein